MFQEIIAPIIENEQSLFIVYAIIIAAIGGFANWLANDKHTISKCVIGVFLAGFAGFLVGEICLAVNITGSWAYFMCGSAGLAGEAIIKFSRQYIIHKTGHILNIENTMDEINEIERKYEEHRREAEEKVTKKAKSKLKRFLNIETDEEKK
jgi:hypothetical protein